MRRSLLVIITLCLLMVSSLSAAVTHLHQIGINCLA